MKVALTAEGTYPHQFGGVSVWCDQLIRGLPHHDFTVIPLVATGNEDLRWQLPANVKSVVTIPLWGRPPSVPLRSRLSRGRNDSLLPELIDVLLSPPAEAQHRFTNVMHDLYDYGQARNLRPALASETAVRLLSDAWRQRWPEILPEATAAAPPNRLNGQGKADPEPIVPTVGDAVVAMQLLEHALRPFSHPPVQADVIHTVTNGLGVLPAVAAKWRYGLPMIVTEHGVYMREHYLHMRRPQFGWPVKNLYLRFLRRLCTLGYQEAEVITPGNVYNKRWETELGADISRIRTVYNGVDPAVFPVLSEEPEVPTISWVGRVDPVKDLETLLRAFSLVIQEIPQARLRMFGAPPQGGEAYLERCRAEAADLGISEQATFEGRVPEIRDAYAAGHVFVLCSISEGFPYTLIEAMACGRACVATDVGGVSEAIGDAAGLVVPPRSPGALADACVRLLRDDSLRQTMGAAARVRAIEHFTVDRAISAFDEMYALLGSGPQEVAAAGPEATREAVTAAPQEEADHRAGETVPRTGRWFALPPEEESTVVAPRPGATALPETDQETTQIMPVLGRGASPDSEHTVIMPRLGLERPESADQERTAIMPRLIRKLAEPSDQEQTGPLPAVRTEPAEPPDEDGETATQDLLDGGSQKPIEEAGQTGGPSQLTEAMK
jgi:glycosyltransferase involved in cell wall biosynthesis